MELGNGLHALDALAVRADAVQLGGDHVRAEADQEVALLRVFDQAESQARLEGLGRTQIRGGGHENVAEIHSLFPYAIMSLGGYEKKKL